MSENFITITIDNYKGKKLTYTAPADSTVDFWKASAVNGPYKKKLQEVTVTLYNETGIKEVEEDLV